MRKITKALAAAAAGGALALAPVAAPHVMAQDVTQDGLVNVAVGDITILEDVRIGVAANVVAQICGVSTGSIAVLARDVDRSGDAQTACRVGEQNAPVDITA